MCQDVFTDPVTLPCQHNFCLNCIRTVWETDGTNEVPLFCPECQVLFASELTLEINASLHAKVKDISTGKTTSAVTQTAAPNRESKFSSINCDHCIETPSVAIRTCLTCDASLCQAHALLHQQRSALREHTVVEVTKDPLSLKCREHREELKLFCMEEKSLVCCLCALVGAHKNHEAAQLHEASANFKVSIRFVRSIELEEKFSKWGIVCIQSALEATMDQLLKRRAEAEHAIKDLESFYAETVVTSKSCILLLQQINPNMCQLSLVVRRTK